MGSRHLELMETNIFYQKNRLKIDEKSSLIIISILAMSKNALPSKRAPICSVFLVMSCGNSPSIQFLLKGGKRLHTKSCCSAGVFLSIWTQVSFPNYVTFSRKKYHTLVLPCAGAAKP